MATLRDIKRRITSVKSTQQITKAMKLVAAAKLRRAQERILEARPYAFKMQEVLASLALRADPQYHPLLCRRETGETTATLVVVGRKTRDFYRRRPYAIRSEQIGFFDRLAYDHAAALGRELANAYVAEEADEIQLVYNEFKSVATQRVVVERLLPIEPLQAPEELATIDFIYEPSPKAILEGLLPKHVEVQVYRALMESLAGEYGARMTAMDAASKNASEMIDLLTLQFNKARQERITKELLEVVGGAEALRAAKG